jgi:hypothetical protein
MKNLLLSLTLLVGSTLMAQEIQKISSQRIWYSPLVGAPLKSLELYNDGKVVFLYNDLQYKYITSYESVLFNNLEDAEAFFLKVKELLAIPYSKNDYTYFKEGDVTVSRVPSLLGIGNTQLSQGSKYCWLEEHLVNKILLKIQEIKNQQS